MATLNVNKDNFNELKSSDKPVLLDFYAKWCGPCRIVGPIIDEIAAENPQYVVGKINIDNEQDLAKEFGVLSIPTLIVLKDGKVAAKSVGAMPKEQILSLIEG